MVLPIYDLVPRAAVVMLVREEDLLDMSRLYKKHETPISRAVGIPSRGHSMERKILYVKHGDTKSIDDREHFALGLSFTYSVSYRR
jgi:hypothetical protein